MIFTAAIFQVHGLKNALTIDEINRFTSILQQHKPRNLEDVYHVVKALKALGKEVPSVEVFPFLYFTHVRNFCQITSLRHQNACFPPRSQDLWHVFSAFGVESNRKTFQHLLIVEVF